MPRCLCVFSRILGWSVFGRFVTDALRARSPGLELHFVDYGAETLRVPVPWYANFGDHSRTQWRLRRLLANKGVVVDEFDVLIFQGHDLALPFRPASGRPVGIIADVTPAITKRRLRWRGGAIAALKRLWWELLDRWSYRPAFAATSAFLVLSEYVKKSLCADYGVAADRVLVVGPPVYGEIASLSRPTKGDRPVMLFVGNDFARKGGVFLLDLYRRHFADSADLWIVSNGVDPAGLEPGIRVFSNIPHAAVLELMLRGDVFLFPSFHDELGLVLAEACCAGLPIVARQSGGQSEYVHDGENGFLLSQDSDLDAWRVAVAGILASEGTRRRFGAYSEALGQRLCSKRRFDAQVAAFLDRLLSELPAE